MVQIIGWPLPAGVVQAGYASNHGRASQQICGHHERRARVPDDQIIRSIASPRKIGSEATRDATTTRGGRLVGTARIAGGKHPGTNGGGRALDSEDPAAPTPPAAARAPPLCCCRQPAAGQLSLRCMPPRTPRRPLLGKWFSEAGGIEPARNQRRSHDAPPSFVVAFLPCGRRMQAKVNE